MSSELLKGNTHALRINTLQTVQEYLLLPKDSSKSNNNMTQSCFYDLNIIQYISNIQNLIYTQKNMIYIAMSNKRYLEP